MFTRQFPVSEQTNNRITVRNNAFLLWIPRSLVGCQIRRGMLTHRRPELECTFPSLNVATCDKLVIYSFRKHVTKYSGLGTGILIQVGRISQTSFMLVFGLFW